MQKYRLKDVDTAEKVKKYSDSQKMSVYSNFGKSLGKSKNE